MEPKVLFIISPVVWQNMPLTGIAYLSEFLDNNNIYNEIMDLNIELYTTSDKKIKIEWLKKNSHFQSDFFYKNEIKLNVKKIMKYIINKKFTHIAFSIYTTNYLFSIEFAKHIKEQSRKAKIIFGGAGVFYFYHYNKKYLLNNNYVDYFVIGEGEETILSIIKDKTKQKIINGINKKDINAIPFPKYKKFNLSLYTRKNALPVVMSRGCINKCNFCAERLLFSHYKVRNYKNVFNEIEYHYYNNNIKWFTFYDSIFNGNLRNLEMLLDLIISKNIKIKWDAQISIRNDMSDSILKKMKTAGCINLFIGLETGSSYILKKMNKKFTLKDAELFFKKLKDNELNFEISLILNYPGESLSDFTNTVKFITDNGYINKVAQINPYVKYPNTNIDITKGYNLFEGINKVLILKDILKKNKIKFTNSYINNLIVG